MSNNRRNTASITEVGILVALIIVIMIITGYVPFVNIIGTLVLPVVYTILYLRHDIKTSLMALLASLLLTSFILGPISALSATITCAPIGITLGYCIKKDMSVYKTIIITAIVSIFSTIASLWLSMTFVDKVGLVETINQSIEIINEQFESALQFYTQAGVQSQALEQINMLKEVLTPKIIISAIPSALVLMSIVSACINYIVTRAILMKLNIRIKNIVPFSKVYLSNLVGAFLIIMVCIGIILNGNGIEAGEYILYSFISIISLLFTINGMAAVTYYFRVRHKMSKGLVFIILLFTLLFGFNTMYIYLGFIEMVFDFRKLDPYSFRGRKIKN